MVEMWLDAVGKGQTVGAAPRVGQPIVVDVVEQVRFAIIRVEQVPRSEPQAEVVAKPFGQAEVKRRRGLLVNVRCATLCDEKQLLTLHVEARRSVDFGTVIRISQHGVDDVWALAKQRTGFWMQRIAGADGLQFIFPDARL